MKRALITLAVVLSVLVVAGGLVYAFGVPQVTQTEVPVAATVQSGGAQEPEADSGATQTTGGGDPSARGKEAPPADPNTPLAIQIPGCVCHSDDQKLVEEHAAYRMNQCAGCHVGGTPTGQ